MAVLGLRFCARAFSSCSKRGPLFITVRGPLTIAASLVAEHRFQTRRLSNCGSRAQLLRGMWDPPRPGLEPVSPALAGRLNHCATREALHPLLSLPLCFPVSVICTRTLVSPRFENICLLFYNHIVFLYIQLILHRENKVFIMTVLK